MLKNKKGFIGLIIFVVFLIILVVVAIAYINENYSAINAQVVKFIENSEMANVSRVIDGDTIVLSDDQHVRLLGINTPEKGEYLYQEAKDYLKSMIEGKSVVLKAGKENKDQYKRLLRWVYINDENINLKIVEQGFANPYFPSNDKKYEQEFMASWENCLAKNLNLCEKSSEACSLCIKLNSLNVEEQTVELENVCPFSCSLDGWTVKDEGRKKLVLKNVKIDREKTLEIIVGNGQDTEEIVYWHNPTYVWTIGGDTMFLRDKEGKRVLYYHYQ